MTRLLLLVLIPFGVAACDGFPTGTSDSLSGSFELAAVGGAPLPAVMWSDAAATGVLHADRLDFRPDGTVTRHYRFVMTPHGSEEVEVFAHVLELEYRRRGRSIEIGRLEPCPPNALCIPNDIGRIRSGGLELESSLWGAGRKGLLYLRQ
ncbi:MAG: hypothetical protein EA350_03725 [Gemmatimonadales bacterium]|nr:MAG: hypothetical protein EA350_03725 [Gemmatimonadales bacterium]